MKRTKKVKKNRKKNSCGGRVRRTRAKRNIRRQKGGAKYKLLSWIDKDKLVLEDLLNNENPAVINILETISGIDSYNNAVRNSLSSQPWAVDFLLEHPNLINKFEFSLNPSTKAVKYLLNNPDKINWDGFSANDNHLAIEYLKQHPDKIDWSNLCINENPEIIELLEKNRTKIDWELLTQNYNNPAVLEFLIRPENINKRGVSYFLNMNKNPEAIKILKENPEKMIPSVLSGNDSSEAIKLLRELPTRKSYLISWSGLSSNKNPEAIKLLKQKPDKIDWSYLCKNENPEAIEMIKNNLEKITNPLYGTSYFNSLTFLSRNPAAIEILEENQDKIQWDILSNNPAAIEILEQNQDKIVWKEFSKNPAIFDYDYKKMKESKKSLHDDYEALLYHPDVRLDPDNPLYFGKVDPDNYMETIKTLKQLKH